MSVLDERPFVPPAFCVIPPYVETIGPEVADLSASFGFVPDREQELWLDGAFGIGGDGMPACWAVVPAPAAPLWGAMQAKNQAKAGQVGPCMTPRAGHWFT